MDSENPETLTKKWRIGFDVQTPIPMKMASMARAMDRAIEGVEDRPIPSNWEISKLDIKARSNPLIRGPDAKSAYEKIRSRYSPRLLSYGPPYTMGIFPRGSMYFAFDNVRGELETATFPTEKEAMDWLYGPPPETNPEPLPVTTTFTVTGIGPLRPIRAFGEDQGFYVFHEDSQEYRNSIYTKPYIFHQDHRDIFRRGDQITIQYYQGPRSRWRLVRSHDDVEIQERALVDEIITISGMGPIRDFTDFRGFSVYYEGGGERPILFDQSHRPVVQRARSEGKQLHITYQEPVPGGWKVVRISNPVSMVEGEAVQPPATRRVREEEARPTEELIEPAPEEPRVVGPGRVRRIRTEERELHSGPKFVIGKTHLLEGILSGYFAVSLEDDPHLYFVDDDFFDAFDVGEEVDLYYEARPHPGVIGTARVVEQKLYNHEVDRFIFRSEPLAEPEPVEVSPRTELYRWATTPEREPMPDWTPRQGDQLQRTARLAVIRELLPNVLQYFLDGQVLAGHPLVPITYSVRSGRETSLRRLCRDEPVTLRGESVENWLTAGGGFQGCGTAVGSKGLIGAYGVLNPDEANQHFLIIDLDIAGESESRQPHRRLFRTILGRINSFLDDFPLHIPGVLHRSAHLLPRLQMFTGRSWHIWIYIPDQSITYTHLKKLCKTIWDELENTSPGQVRWGTRGSLNADAPIIFDYMTNASNKPIRLPYSMHSKTGLLAIPTAFGASPEYWHPGLLAHPLYVRENLHLSHNFLADFMHGVVGDLGEQIPAEVAPPPPAPPEPPQLPTPVPIEEIEEAITVDEIEEVYPPRPPTPGEVPRRRAEPEVATRFMIVSFPSEIPTLPYIPREIEEAGDNEVLKRIMGPKYLLANTSDTEFFDALLLTLTMEYPGDDRWQYRTSPRKLLAFRTTAASWNALRQEGARFHRNRTATSIHQKLQRRGGTVGVIIVLEE